jgi:hypothetical protein
MEKITIGQFLNFTNYYVPLYIEDEFQRYESKGKTISELNRRLTEEQKECPIDYIRNVDGGHSGDEKKVDTAIVLGIGLENWEKYFGKE